MAPGSSFIQVCRFLRAKSTSFWQRMSSETSERKAVCGGGEIQGLGLGGVRRGADLVLEVPRVLRVDTETVSRVSTASPWELQ